MYRPARGLIALMRLALSWSWVHLGREDPLGGVDVEVTEARVESVTFRPRMPTPVQTVATARPAVLVSMVGSSRTRDAGHSTNGRRVERFRPSSTLVSERSIRRQLLGSPVPNPLIRRVMGRRRRPGDRGTAAPPPLRLLAGRFARRDRRRFPAEDRLRRSAPAPAALLSCRPA